MGRVMVFIDGPLNEDWPKRTDDDIEYPIFPERVTVGFVSGALVASCELHGEFACTSKACAPPPVGRGGSLPSGGGDGSSSPRVRGRTKFAKSVNKMIADDPELSGLSRSASDPDLRRKAAYADYHARLREAIKRPLGSPDRNLIDGLIEVHGTGGDAQIHQKVLDLFKPEMLQEGWFPEPYSDEEGAYIAVREVLLDKKRESMGGILIIDGKTIHFSLEIKDKDLRDALRPPSTTERTVKSVITVGSKVRAEIAQRLKSHPLLSEVGAEQERLRHEQQTMEMSLELAQQFPGLVLDQSKMWISKSSGNVILPANAIIEGAYQQKKIEDFLNSQIKRRKIRDLDAEVHVALTQSDVRTSLLLNTLKEIRPFGGEPLATITASGVDGKNMRKELRAGADGIPSAWIEMSNRRGSVTAVYTSDRASYHDLNSQILLSGSVDTARHELIHRMEYSVPGLRELEAKFYEMRTANDKELKKLSDLSPSHGYRDNEVSKPDKFWNPYVGKWYQGEAYEVMSMGVEYVYRHAVDRTLFNEDALKKFPIMDEQYIDFVIGTMLTTQWEDQ